MANSNNNGTTTSFSKTPQAKTDVFGWTEDALLSVLAFNSLTDILSLDVMANDLGGNAKSLYSVDDGTNYLADLLQADTQTNGVSAWEAIGGGDTIRIDKGKVDVNLSHSIFALTGSTDINALAAGDHIHDTFNYAIRLGNGTLSWSTVTLDIYGSNDAATITGTAAGSVTEDGTLQAFR